MSQDKVTDVVVAGGTGLIGREALGQLAGRAGVRVTALVRKPGAGLPAGVNERVFDYESDASYAAIGADFGCDVLLCCLGTTRTKAGSDEAFRRVDRDYPVKLLARLKALGGERVYGLVSSIGADKPTGLYLKTKHEVESAVIASGLPYVIVRPSVLLGERAESRPGERVAIALGKPLFGLLQAIVPGGAVARYAPIEGAQVAAALIDHCLVRPAPREILSGAQIKKITPG